MKLGRGFAPAAERARAQPGTDLGRALAATMRAIADTANLPAYCDYLVQIPPTQEAFVRRVRNLNLWVFFILPDASSVVFITLVTQPPVPTFIDDPDDPPE